MQNREFEQFARVLIYLLLVVVAVFLLLPFAWMVTAAFKSNEDIFSSLLLPPGAGFLGVAWERLTLHNFDRLFAEEGIARAMLNSTFYASVTAIGATTCSAMGGYALAKFSFRGRRLLTVLVLGAVLVPGPLLLAPGYQLLHQLGLLNTYAGLILPSLAPAFGVFLFRQAMLNSVPDEIIEAARIDGAGELRIFFSVVLPVVRPMLGAFLLISFLGAWNNFIGPQIVLQDPALYPLSSALAGLRGTNFQEWGMIMAGTMVSVAPVMGLFLLLQREFIQGLTSEVSRGAKP